MVCVEVAIFDAKRRTIERGNAILKGKTWRYTAQTTLAAGQAVTIDVVASDRPGREGRSSAAWPTPRLA